MCSTALQCFHTAALSHSPLVLVLHLSKRTISQHSSGLPMTYLSLFHSLLPIFFCDGSFSDLAAASTILVNNQHLYTRWHLPQKYAQSQQSVELYAFVRTFSLALSMFDSFCIVTDSTSALYFATFFKSGIHQPARAAMLRFLASKAQLLTVPTHALWIPSLLNPADYPSRNLPFSHSLSPFLHPSPSLYINPSLSLPPAN